MDSQARRWLTRSGFFVVLLAFLMPWLAVSCGQVRIEATGVDLVSGRTENVQGSNRVFKREPIAIGILVTAAAGLIGAVVLMRSRGAKTALSAVAVLGMALLVWLWLRIRSEIEGTGAQPGAITIQWLAGYWIAWMGFLVASIAELFGMEKSGDS